MKSHNLLTGILVLGIALGILNLSNSPGAPENDHHKNRTAVAFKTPPGGTTLPTGRALQLVATVDVGQYSQIRLAGHCEVNAQLHISMIQDGEEIAPLSDYGTYPLGPLGLPTGNYPPLSLNFAVPGTVLRIMAENTDFADGRLTLVVYGRE